ncbi:translation initiation factor IF-2-like [Serinus canaria]|uniref:translation initiation factor IF-2-like n=1 Tax=Serinus canaria TaxID=9135 RepID=UPI0021CC5FDC|nr:translation initiation factor IF-2-like [Serinus canaria]
MVKEKWKRESRRRKTKSAGRERHMDDDDEDEDEDGDGDPDAPPAPAAPLLLTSASSTSASHRWPQPPPTSTVRHIDTATDRPRLLPCRGPTLRLPRPPTARPPAQTPIRRLADLTGWAGAAPGCGETAERGPDGTRRHGELRAHHPAPRPGRCPSSPPPSPRPCYFFFIYFPVEKEKNPPGCERPLRGGEPPPLPAHGVRSAGRGSGGSARCPPRCRSLPPSPAEPPGRRPEPGDGSAPPSPRRASAARGGGGGGAAGAPGDGKEGGSRVQRCVRGRQSLGSVAAFQQLRLEQLRALGAGGAPQAGARLAGWLPARLRGGVKPHYTGFNVSRRPAGTRAPRGGGGAPRPRSRRKVRPRGEEATAPPDFPPGRCPDALRCPRRERLQRSAAAGPGPPRRAPPQGHP